jgi:hypothetical protein
MPRLASVFAILSISGLTGSVPIAAAAAGDHLAAPRTEVSRTQFAERMIVCGPRRGCRALREGCRLVLAAHPRNNRIVCGPVRAA